ncbi:hypothetical protein QBC35DRAFT_24861 [Podospora australis]|uniref:Protein SSH4 n=1 Tax=Podospora australis TaxID=1536484 RepID=A0AAN6X1K5_9PEZI|nr:hypothetical protein QBC35DRAFT_24861 [Podospora australis]
MSNPYPYGSAPNNHFDDDNSLPPLNVRPTSYASVVSGAQQAWPTNQSSTMAFGNLLNPATPGNSQQYMSNTNSSSSMRNSRIDSGIRTGGGSGMIPSYLSRNGSSEGEGNLRNSSLNAPWPPPRLGSNVPMSRAFDFFMNKEPLISSGTQDSNNGVHESPGAGANPTANNISSTGFLSPSYLRGSSYLQQLEDRHKSRILSEREKGNERATRRAGLASNGSSTGLPTITSKLHHSGTSHRGVSYDVVEKSAAGQEAEEEDPTPLPSKWNKEDKDNALDISSDGYEVTYTGKPSSDHEASAVRADHGINPSCGVYYFEVIILNKKRSSSDDMPQIGVGFSSRSASLSRAPGWEPESWGYHGDDGHAFAAHSSGKPYGLKFGPGDNIGCLINFRLGHALFTRNGIELKVAFRDLDFKSLRGKVYPTVGLKKSGDHIRVNFGQLPFLFDIDGYMKKQRALIEDEVRATDTRILAPSLSETELIQQLVLQFLQHDGYVETARAFAEELQSEKAALRLSSKDTVKGINVKDDEDAHKRQSIRSAILEGDIDRAMKYTNEYYPDVLKNNEEVYFRLRCRKFVEMIRKEAELNLANEKRNPKKTVDIEDDEEMLEADSASEWDDGMETDYNVNAAAQDAILYGQELRAEFTSDQRTKYLDEISSLIAYTNPLKVPEISHLMDGTGRVAVAEELNSAILTSLGKSSRSALENVYAQTNVLLEDLRKDGGPGAFVTLQRIVDQIPPNALL